MFFNKAKKFDEIINSKNGLHLTAYLSKTQGSEPILSQLQKQIEDASELLKPILNPKQVRRFLKPLTDMVDNPNLLFKLGDNIGIYRTTKSLRVLSLPIDVEPMSSVATTFHVKPILKWLQVDPSFMLVGVHEGAVYICEGDQSSAGSLELVDMDGLNSKIQQMTKFGCPPLYLAGSEEQIRLLLTKFKYSNTVTKKVFSFFSPKHIQPIIASIRLDIRQQVSQKVKTALIEVELADDLNLARKNIFEIAKLAVKGRIRKLIVADGLRIFGKINMKTGGLTLHPFELDHEDDDILDDLAQTVLQNGGEVLVVDKSLIPNRRVAMAIVHGQQLMSSQPQAHSTNLNL